MAAPSEKPVDVAEVLAEGDLELIGQIRSASNATLVCDAVAGETSVRCVYKPVRGEQPLWDFPDGTLAGREVASYLVSEALGWSVIPVTLLRDGPFGPGMVQRWIDTPEPSDGLPTRLDVVDLCSPDLVPEGWKVILSAIDARGEDVVLVHADDPRLQRMAVLDVLINNADRKGGHVLEGLDGQVYGVDHGICLHSDDKLRTVLWGWAGENVPAHLLEDVSGLLDALREETSPLREKLSGLITAAEIEALATRTAIMLGDPVMPDANRSRPIPWPAF
ncbi:putative repeat protein (TIGR03843 family) [Williamsia muralis]|uniref:Putative repeat protein (TIGR03843 family) n=1 Tax=Williamsia marianensis TaxID=85044 RepID=A0A495K2N3_WILMA|nr:SCO1664 family protein [Williamsia muralis]RKR95520.1 putative repeat protein (TIGR03843 family) [Williamsia muralis]